MGPATSRLYEAVVDRLVTHDGSPALARHVANAVLKEDSRGARLVLVKEHKMSRRHIDGAPSPPSWATTAPRYSPPTAARASMCETRCQSPDGIGWPCAGPSVAIAGIARNDSVS